MRMMGSFRLGHIAGIEIKVNYTWFLALILIAWSLAQGFFPQTWGPVTCWIVGIISALLLFVSVLIHELAHSLVAKSRGLGVRSITLFIFGGVSNLEDEPARPKLEFTIAIVGPLSSLVLGGIFWGLEQVVGQKGSPLSEMLFYLALINVMLAGFNLLPGFPLDGGRVLRSIIWGITKSLAKATKIATTVGQILGWGFIALGIFLAFSNGDVLDGLWIAFIGWFLISAARVSRRQVMIRENSTGARVRDVMNPTSEYVGPGTPVDNVVRENFVQRGRRAVPICQWDQLVGIVTLTDVKKLPQDRWAQTPVQEIMTRSPLLTVTSNDELNTAIKLIQQHDINQILVVDGGRLAGILSRNDIVSYLKLRQEPVIKRNKKTSIMELKRTVLIVLGTLIGYAALLVSQPWLSFGLLLSGLGVTMYGCYLWVKLKGRLWTWMFFGLFSPIGLIALAVLKSKKQVPLETTTWTT